MKKCTALTFVALILLGACALPVANVEQNSTDTISVVGFEMLTSEGSGIHFSNSIKESEDFNYFKFGDIYSGAGVAVGDINNDGLPDIYFVGNQVSDKLYLNKGDLKFEDITSSAFDIPLDKGWHTGANINGDGWLDIFVARSGSSYFNDELRNYLFINNQDNTFSEQAVARGLITEKRTKSACFFDYDNDNDLDLYVVNRPEQTEQLIFTSAELRASRINGPDEDIFYENIDGVSYVKTAEAGLVRNTYSHSVGAGDFNRDGHLDALVVGNNFGVEVETIRYDGGRGVVLLGDGKGNFRQLTPLESGFFENRDCKDMAIIKFQNETLVITVSNQAKSKTFRLKRA